VFHEFRESLEEPRRGVGDMADERDRVHPKEVQLDATESITMLSRSEMHEPEDLAGEGIAIEHLCLELRDEFVIEEPDLAGAVLVLEIDASGVEIAVKLRLFFMLDGDDLPVFTPEVLRIGPHDSSSHRKHGVAELAE
jgi:hypothetical protein